MISFIVPAHDEQAGLAAPCGRFTSPPVPRGGLDRGRNRNPGNHLHFSRHRVNIGPL